MAYASRSLTASGQNYAQIGKELAYGSSFRLRDVSSVRLRPDSEDRDRS